MDSKLLKYENKVFVEFYHRKKSADRVWDKVFSEAMNGNVNQVALEDAIAQCNIADKALIDQEKTKRSIKAGSKLMSDDEWERKYVEPYRQKL